MKIENCVLKRELFQDADLFLYSINYEERSRFLYDFLSPLLNKDNSIAFVINNERVKMKPSLSLKTVKEKSNLIEAEYDQYEFIVHTVLSAIKKKMSESISLQVHIDYSSMPRLWYCNLLLSLKDFMRKDDTLYFWYSEGEYPNVYKSYPSAGTESYMLFSGKAETKSDSLRTHIIAFGYDKIRTSAIISTIDPECVIACYAYNPSHPEVAKYIQKVNKQMLAKAAMTIVLQTVDFYSLLSKLCDITNEILAKSEVVLLPDGPKPLVLAMSLVPLLVNRSGVTCLHIKRNMDCFIPVQVKPTGAVFGFTLKRD